jgi:hypothetical protein
MRLEEDVAATHAPSTWFETARALTREELRSGLERAHASSP